VELIYWQGVSKKIEQNNKLKSHANYYDI